MIDFAPVHAARLKPGDLCKLVGVGRVACSMWLNDHCQPHHLLTEKVQKVVDAIQAAVDAGSLPVPYSVTRRERAYYIREAILTATAEWKISPL